MCEEPTTIGRFNHQMCWVVLPDPQGMSGSLFHQASPKGQFSRAFPEPKEYVSLIVMLVAQIA